MFSTRIKITSIREKCNSFFCLGFNWQNYISSRINLCIRSMSGNRLKKKRKTGMPVSLPRFGRSRELLRFKHEQLVSKLRQPLVNGGNFGSIDCLVAQVKQFIHCTLNQSDLPFNQAAAEYAF